MPAERIQRRIQYRSIYLIFYLVLLFCIQVSAASTKWTGSGDGSTWGDANNWSTNSVPSQFDHVTIDKIGVYTVQLTKDAQVAGLDLGATSGTQTLDCHAFVLTIGFDSSIISANGVLVIGENVAFNRTIFHVDAPIIVRGRLEWGSGEVYADNYYLPSSSKGIIIDSSGVLRWYGNIDRVISAALSVRGTLNWESANTYYYQGYTCRSSGVFDINVQQSTQFLRMGVNSQGPWIWENTGTVRKRGNASMTFQIELHSDSAIVDVVSDTLLLNNATRWHDATIRVASGATLKLQSNGTLEPHIISGTLSGSPQGTFIASSLPNGNPTNISADTMGTSVIDIRGMGLQLGFAELGGVYDALRNSYRAAPNNSGLIRLVGTAHKTISGAFVNNDSLVWEGGDLVYYTTGVFLNNSTFKITVSDSVTFRPGGINGNRPGPFRNKGVLQMSGTGCVISTVDLFNINAQFVVSSGIFEQAWVSRWENSSLRVDSASTLRFSGYLRSHVIAGNLQGSAQGTFLISGFGTYNTALVSDSVMQGFLDIGANGVQIMDADVGDWYGAPAPINRGRLRFVGNNSQFIKANLVNDSLMQWERGAIYVNPGLTILNRGLFEFSSTNGIFQGDGFGSVTTIINDSTAVMRKLDTGRTNFRCSIANNGKLCIANGTMFIDNTLNNLGTFTIGKSGIISGVGKLDLSRQDVTKLQNDGTTSPGPGDAGEGVGTLTVAGPLPQGRLNFELQGTDSASYDRLILTQSSIDISSDTARVTLLNGFTPQPGDFFDVVAGHVLGALAVLIVNPSNVPLVATYPPDLVRLIFDPSKGPKLTIIAPNLSARQGSAVPIPITVIASQNTRKAGVKAVRFTLRYNATMLAPQGSTPQGTIVNRQRNIALDISIDTTKDTTIASLDFVAALGNDSLTVLAIDSASSNVLAIPTFTQDGSFKVLDLCREGDGPRLLNPEGTIVVTLMQKSSVSDYFDLELTMIEREVPMIRLCDMRGNIHDVVTDLKAVAGTQLVRVDCRTVCSGSYLLLVESPTTRTVLPLRVVR